MDPLSIAAGCASLISTIGTLSVSIHGFVRTCREARKDLDKVSRELQSLQSVLRLIEDDATDEEKPFPPLIGQHVLSIVSNCNSVILEIESCIAQYGQKRLKAQVTWATGGQGDVEKLRTSLEAHKSSLELALDMHGLTITKDIKADTTEIRNDTTAIKDNTEQILHEIVRLQAQLPRDVMTPNDYVLQRFLEEMTTYTEAAMDTTIIGSDNDSIRAFSGADVSESQVAGTSSSNWTPSNIPQAPILSKAELVPPNVLALRTSSGGNLATSDQPQPPRPFSPNGLEQRTQAIPYRRDNRTESSATLGPPRNLVSSELHISPDSKDTLGSEDSDADTAEDQTPQRSTFVLNEAPIYATGIQASLLNGNLAIDFRFLHALADRGWEREVSARLRGEEFGSWRLTAVTCPPRQFTAENYLLRHLMSSKPESRTIILSFQLMPREPPADFVKRWSIIRMGLDHLDPWSINSIIVHVHAPTGWKRLHHNIFTALEEMSINRRLVIPIHSVDGHELRTPFHSYSSKFLGKPVHCIMRETLTIIYPYKAMFWSSKLQLKAHTVPVRVISTDPATADDSYRDWVTAIGQQLGSKLVIDMTNVSGEYRGFDGYISQAQRLDEKLPHTMDTWGIGLRFVRFADLIIEMYKRGYKK